MKKKFKLIAILGIVMLSLTACQNNKVSDKELLLSTKDFKISERELYDEMKNGYGFEVMIRMVDDKLLNDKFKTTVEEKEFVKEQLEQIKASYNMYGQYQSFEDYLSAMGLKSEEELKNILKIAYKRGQLTKEYAKKSVSEKDIKKYYENMKGKMKASHILIIPDYKDSDDEKTKRLEKEKAEKTANDILKRLKKGEDFKKLAKEFSEDAKEKAGDLGWLDLDTLDPSFAKALNKLKVDELSDKVVESKFGYHIILKTGEKEKEKLEKVKDDIIKKLASEKEQKDPNLSAKALVDLRKEKGLEIKDRDLAKKYKTYVNNLD